MSSDGMHGNESPKDDEQVNDFPAVAADDYDLEQNQSDELKLMEDLGIQDRFTQPLKVIHITFLVIVILSTIFSVILVALGFTNYLLLVDAIFRLVACIVGLGGVVVYILRISDFDKKQIQNAFKLMVASDVMLSMEFVALLSILIYNKLSNNLISGVAYAMWLIALMINISSLPLIAVGIAFAFLLRARITRK